MTNTNHDGPPDGRPYFDQELDEQWAKLEEDLASYLSTMVDPNEDDHLILELPGPSENTGCPPYVQFAAFGEGRMIRAEVSGNAHLTPQYQLGKEGCEFFAELGWFGNDDAEKNWCIERPVAGADEIANHVMSALRSYFGVAHPQLLTHQAWGPACAGASGLGLCSTAEVPAEEPTQGLTPIVTGAESVLEQVALTPGSREDLVAIVASVLREKYADEPTIDDDGDFVLHHLGQAVWVRVRHDQLAIQIMARVAHEVYSRRAAAVELGLLNRDNLWVSWALHDRTVWQTLALPGLPFVPSHLFTMLDLFLEAMTATRDDLAYRTRAKVA